MTVNHNGINATRDGKAVWEPDAEPATPQTARDAVIAAAPAAVSVPPPAPQAADRRERYAAAIADGFRAFDADTTSDAYLDAELLDAVVAVADAEEAELLAAVPVVPPATLQTAEEHRLALSEALGLGTGAPWDAIHDRVTELGLPPLGRDPVARRLGLLAAYRATILTEGADAVFALDYDVMVGEEGDENLGSMREAWDLGTIHAEKLLRRLAAVSGPCVAGEQQNETPEAGAPTATKPETAADRDTLRRQFGDVLRRWGLLDEQIDQKAAEEYAVTDLLALLPEQTSRDAEIEHLRDRLASCRERVGIAADKAIAAEDVVARARRARRRLTSALIAVEPLLTEPYPDDPRWTPWTRFVGPALKELSDALKTGPAANDEPPAAGVRQDEAQS